MWNVVSLMTAVDEVAGAGEVEENGLFGGGSALNAAEDSGGDVGLEGGRGVDDDGVLGAQGGEGVFLFEGAVDDGDVAKVL